MKIPIIDEFDEKEFNEYINEEEIELVFYREEPNYKLTHNFKEWSFLKKFKKLKVLKLVCAEINKDISHNFFSNLYALDKLEKLIIDDQSVIETPIKSLPTNLFPKKLKEYEISFNLEYMPSDIYTPNKGKDYNDYHGIGNLKDLHFTYDHWKNYLLQIYDFPNFDKFISLETLNFYNFFYSESYQGHLFEMDNSEFLKKSYLVKDLIINSKVKNVNFVGLNFDHKNLYTTEKAVDDKTGKSFNYYDSEVFKSIANISSQKKVTINESDPLKLLQKYYGNLKMSEILKLSSSKGIPKEVKNFTVGKEGSIQLKFKR